MNIFTLIPLKIIIYLYMWLGCYQQSPLHIAAEKGYEAIVKLLLQNKAEPDIKDEVSKQFLLMDIN